jgi:drug/metabolite transporter (DMT)-like permease
LTIAPLRPNRQSAALAPVAVAVLIMVAWGGTPVFSKLAADEIDPVLVGLMRTALAGLVAAPFLVLRREPLPGFGRGRLLLAVSGLSGFVLFPVLYTFGQERTSAIHGVVILAALPIATGAYASLVERRRPPVAWLVGCTVALGGEAAMIALRAGGERAPSDLLGDALICLSVLVVTAGYVAGARLGQLGYRSLATTLWGVALSAIVVAPALAGLTAANGWPEAGGAAWGSIVFLAVVTSIVGYVGWYWALARGGISRIAVVQFLQPFSGLVLAAVVLGERFTAALAAASAAILVGVWIAVRTRRPA